MTNKESRAERLPVCFEKALRPQRTDCPIWGLASKRLSRPSAALCPFNPLRIPDLYL